MEKTLAMFAELLKLIRALRGEGGCPWDRKQTLASLQKYLQEESRELAEAIDQNDSERIQEEIGDTLFLLLFVAEVGRDLGYFSIDDVLQTIREKMIRRHPHVFGEHQAKDMPAIRESWEIIKDQEKRDLASRSPGDRIPRHLSPCLRVYWFLGKLREWESGPNRATKGAATLTDRAAALEKLAALGEGEKAQRQIGLMFLGLIDLCHRRKMNPDHVVEEALAGLVESVEHKAMHVKGIEG